MQTNMSNLAHNILSQASSFNAVLDWQCGGGRKLLLEAAVLLRSGKRVLITGLGASRYASLPLEYYLCSHGIEAVGIEAGELLHFSYPAYRDSIVVIVSRSGESIEITKLLEVLKGRQIIIGVTNEPDGLLAKSADCPLLVGSLADEIVAIQTYTGTVLALYLLGAAVTQQFEPACETLYSLHPGFDRIVTGNMDAAEKWDRFLHPTHSVYLLARGPSCASAFEGALLFNEIAKTAAVGQPVASFRHGPAEVVDEAFRGILFVPQGPTREMTLSLGRDLIRFGGRVSVIGSELELAGADPIGEIPNTSLSLAPLFEVVPIQVAAFRMAQLRGIVPGSFRYTSQVARDEASFGTNAAGVQAK
jgi:glutamine---fructose-6-phosphate transaminase (isomerizing)